jgi:hypothetical protein
MYNPTILAEIPRDANFGAYYFKKLNVGISLVAFLKKKSLTQCGIACFIQDFK